MESHNILYICTGYILMIPVKIVGELKLKDLYLNRYLYMRLERNLQVNQFTWTPSFPNKVDKMEFSNKGDSHLFAITHRANKTWSDLYRQLLVFKCV